VILRRKTVQRLLLAAFVVAMLARSGCGGDTDPQSAVGEPSPPVPRPPFYAVDVPRSAPVRGPNQALVTIVTFADLQAGRTARNASSLNDLVERFPGKLRVVHRANPLPKHSDARRAELAVRAAGRQGKFWELHDALLERGKLGEADLLATASAVDLDVERLRADMDDPALAAEVARDRQAALELGIDSSPMSFVNGRPLEPVRFVDDAAELVKEELERAKGRVSAGTPLEKLYGAIVDGGGRRLPGAQRATRKVLDPEAVYRVPVLGDDPVRGPADALLTIVIFADFECPYSARAAAALAGLQRELKGQVRVVFKHSPLPSHPTAALSAEAAVEAQTQGRFWEIHDALFARFRELDEDKLLEIGEGSGLDRDKLAAALRDRSHSERVERDRKLAAELGLHGTPHLFLNGTRVRGSRSTDQLLALARPLVKEADRVRRTPARSPTDAGADLTLYDRIIADGAAAPVYAEPGSSPADPDVVTDGKYRVYDIVVPDDAPFLGPRDAPVTVVEFGDYQCGWCRRAYPALQALRKRFGDEVRVVFMHFPIAGHEHARQAAEAAVEAQYHGKFWEFHEKLLESSGALAEEDLVEHARDIGLDPAAMRDALEARSHRDRVRQDVRAARALGVAGTPAFFVNGRKGSATRFEQELPELVEHVLTLRKTGE